MLSPLAVLACVVEDGCAETRCHHCFDKLRKPVRACERCGFARFCSDECEHAAASDGHHPHLCDALQKKYEGEVVELVGGEDILQAEARAILRGFVSGCQLHDTNLFGGGAD